MARLAAHPAQQQATARGGLRSRRGRAAPGNSHPAVIAIGGDHRWFQLALARRQPAREGGGEGDAGRMCIRTGCHCPPVPAAHSPAWRSVHQQQRDRCRRHQGCALATVCGRTLQLLRASGRSGHRGDRGGFVASLADQRSGSSPAVSVSTARRPWHHPPPGPGTPHRSQLGRRNGTRVVLAADLPPSVRRARRPALFGAAQIAASRG